jgi:hypothetical protein
MSCGRRQHPDRQARRLGHDAQGCLALRRAGGLDLADADDGRLAFEGHEAIPYSSTRLSRCTTSAPYS